MGRLISYFQGPRIDSEGQLREAQRKNESAELLYLRQRARKTGGTEGGSRLKLDSMLSWHPKNTLTRASNAIRSATER